MRLHKKSGTALSCHECYQRVAGTSPRPVVGTGRWPKRAFTIYSEGIERRPVTKREFLARIRDWSFGAALIGRTARSADKPAKPFSSYDPLVRKLLAQMTLDEKIGQMVQPDHASLTDPADVENYFLGSVLSGGDSDPKGGNTLADWTDLYDTLQRHTSKTRLQIPLLYGIDAVHGHNNVLGAVLFPHNIGLGCTRNPKLIQDIARVTADEVRATGINWAFGPCVAVPQDVRWGRTYEAYSDDPKLVGELAAAAIRGIQGPDLAMRPSVLACAKHYAGDGGTTFGTGHDGKGFDQGDTRVDEPTLRRIHLSPYVAAIAAGVGSIMPSYSSWNGVKCSASKRLLTEILKQEFGFQGFLISDYDALDQLSPDFKKSIEISINAGMDMVMVTDKYRQLFTDVQALVKEGRVPTSRIDDAVTRILRVKFALGLMDKPAGGRDQYQKNFGSAAHRAVAREAVRQSLVLLKNDHRALPVSKRVARIHVAGKSADNIGNQCGGWTITWQGQSGAATTGGTTILSAIKQSVSGSTQVTFSEDGSGGEGASIGIAVIGESPYAEFMGDRTDLALTTADMDVVRKLKQAGLPVIVILISGRPLIVNDLLPVADALIAAWLPGTEGAGVADVIFGDHKPTGKLSFAWPRTIAANGEAHPAQVLFGNGYGLTY